MSTIDAHATAHKAKYHCRNPRCRSRLPEAVENGHRAFCTRGCYKSFYRNRCRVCERDLRKTGKRDAGRLYCRPPAKCRQEAQKWPEKYEGVIRAGFTTTKLRSTHSTGLKIGLRADLPTAHCLREWSWGGDPDQGDHSLYDKGGLTLARIVFDGGHWHLRTPIAIPCQSWPDLDQAKRGAESFAVMAIPLEALDSRLAGRIKRDNETPHPMGPPPNRPPPISDATSSDWRAIGNDTGVPDIPDFLRRRPR